MQYCSISTLELIDRINDPRNFIFRQKWIAGKAQTFCGMLFRKRQALGVRACIFTGLLAVDGNRIMDQILDTIIFEIGGKTVPHRRSHDKQVMNMAGLVFW